MLEKEAEEMAFNHDWDPKTKEGKRRLKAIWRILKKISHRGEIPKELNKDPALKSIGFDAIQIKLRRETSRNTALGKKWKSIPPRENMLYRLFPDPKTRERLKADVANLPPEEVMNRHEQWRKITKAQRNTIKDQLGLLSRRPPRSYEPPKDARTAKSWWSRLTTAQRKGLGPKLLADWRADYRTTGSDNDSLVKRWKKYGCPNVDGLKYAVRTLGETRSRSQIADKIAKSRRRVSTEDVWKIQGLEARCRQLVQEGWLNKADGVQHILQTINTEFAAKLGEDGKLTERVLTARLPQLVWTPEVQKQVRRANSSRIPLDEFHQQYYSWIPEGMWNKQIKFFRGLSDAKLSASFIAGVGRLITDELGSKAELFEFPPNNFAHPLEVSVGEDWTLPVINGAHIGIVYDPDIENNPLRRALSDARKRGSAAVVITNLIHLDTKKTAGVGHVYRAQVSGLRIKPEHLPPSYRAEAERIMRDHPDDEVVYQSIAARFLGILDALFKIFNRPNERGPEYTGKVIYTLGYLEEELINEAANAELRYLKILKANRLSTEIQLVNRLTAEAEKEENWVQAAQLESRRMALSEQLATTILTNVSDEDRNRQRRRIRALFVMKVQEVIPHCTVVGQGSIYLKARGKVVKIHIPSNIDVTDGHLASFADNYGAEVFRDTLADLTIICHPYAFNHRLVGREDSKDGQPVTKYARVAPLCLDDAYIRDRLKDTTRELHPIQRCVHNPQFKAGVLLVNCTNGILSADSLPITKSGTNFAHPGQIVKYITWFLNTDNHFGAPDKRYIWDPENRIHLGATEATIEMMRREGILNPDDIGIHCTAEMDDATNGDMWFQPRYRQWPQEMTVIHIEHWLRQMTSDLHRAAERGNMELVGRITEEINRVSIAQHYFRGEDFPFAQMEEVFDRHIDPNIDFYSAVLGRFVKAGLVIRGVSKINQAMSDMRDLGVHNFPEGNHRIRSLDQRDLEGDHIARHLREKLAQLPEWQRQLRRDPEFLKERILAPRFGNQTFGWGTIKSPKGFEWGIRIHGSPARQDSWSDILKAVIKSDLARGDDTYGLLKRNTVTFFGDKHFYAQAETAYIFYFMCAAGVSNSQYGSAGGFPPNNTGTAFVGIPDDGPDEGPIIVRMMPHDFLRDWFANPKPFNWKKFLPRPV